MFQIIGDGKYMDRAISFYSKLKIPELRYIIMKLPNWYFTFIINVFHLYSQSFPLKLTKFLKNLHEYLPLPLILPCTFLFTK